MCGAYRCKSKRADQEFTNALSVVWVPLSALPYFVLYARDLRLCGYRRSDVVRVYALSLVLLPVIMGGVLKSIQQSVTGAKTPFARTPKVFMRSAGVSAWPQEHGFGLVGMVDPTARGRIYAPHETRETVSAGLVTST